MRALGGSEENEESARRDCARDTCAWDEPPSEKRRVRFAQDAVEENVRGAPPRRRPVTPRAREELLLLPSLLSIVDGMPDFAILYAHLESLSIDWKAVSSIRVLAYDFSCVEWDEFVLGDASAAFNGMKDVAKVASWLDDADKAIAMNKRIFVDLAPKKPKNKNESESEVFACSARVLPKGENSPCYSVMDAARVIEERISNQGNSLSPNAGSRSPVSKPTKVNRENLNLKT